jgi:hypothetical protein
MQESNQQAVVPGFLKGDCIMAFTFRIVFSGLCAFVPNKPFGITSQQEVRVLLPNVLKARTIQRPQPDADDVLASDAFILPPHFPLLTFDERTLRQSSGQIFHFVKERLDLDKPAGRRTGVTLLQKQDLYVWPDGREPRPESLRLINGPVENLDNPSAEEKESLFWLTKIDELLGAGRPPIPELLRESLDQEENRIITRIRLQEGRLKTHSLTDPRWEYLPVGQVPVLGAGKKVARSLALELEADEKVKLVFRAFGSADTQKMIFAPPLDDPHEDVEIQLLNLEPDNLLGVKEEEEEEALSPSIDPDFAVYYDLIKGFQKQEPRPIPQRFTGEGAERITGDGKPCAPTGMGGT